MVLESVEEDKESNEGGGKKVRCRCIMQKRLVSSGALIA